MTYTWMGFAACLVWAAADGSAPDSFLIDVRPNPTGQVVGVTEPYTPQPGDLVFFNCHSKKWVVLYKLVGSDAPYHTGIAFRRRDGSLAYVEAGPNDSKTCQILAWKPRLQDYHGTIHVRRLKEPLGPEQSAVLTDWAEAQDGKRYATLRLLLQGTPFRCRGPLRRDLFGKTDLNRSSYLCAELVVAAGTVAGLFDPDRHPGNAMYPRDLILDDHYDLSQRYHPARQWTATPFAQPLRLGERQE